MEHLTDGMQASFLMRMYTTSGDTYLLEGTLRTAPVTSVRNKLLLLYCGPLVIRQADGSAHPLVVEVIAPLGPVTVPGDWDAQIYSTIRQWWRAWNKRQVADAQLNGLLSMVANTIEGMKR